jgi:hypothetical protein
VNEWIELTSRNDRAKVWINLSFALSVLKEAGGSKISFSGKDVFVTESPEVIMARRAEVQS